MLWLENAGLMIDNSDWRRSSPPTPQKSSSSRASNLTQSLFSEMVAVAVIAVSFSISSESTGID